MSQKSATQNHFFNVLDCQELKLLLTTSILAKQTNAKLNSCIDNLNFEWQKFREDG